MKTKMKDLVSGDFINYKGKTLWIWENKLTATSSALHVRDVKTYESDVIVGHVDHELVVIVNPYC